MKVTIMDKMYKMCPLKVIQPKILWSLINSTISHLESLVASLLISQVFRMLLLYLNGLFMSCGMWNSKTKLNIF